jgi:hypothetical protein
MFQLPNSAQEIFKIFETPEEGLDQVKKAMEDSLDKLKKSPGLGDLAGQLYKEAEEGLVKDMEEIGAGEKTIQEAKRTFQTAWQEQMQGRITAEALESPERLEIDAFIAHVENLPRLQEIMASHEPQAKWQTFLKGIFGKNPYLIEAVGMFSPTLKTFLDGVLGNKPAEGAKAEAGQEEQDGQTEEEAEKSEGEDSEEQVQEDVEKEPVKPKSTLILGDSINSVFKSKQNKEKFEVNGKVEEITEGARNADWLWNQIKDKPDEYFKKFENAIVLIGTNDLGESTSGEDIWKRIDKIHRFLHSKGVRVYACTLPPGKGNKSGEWGSNFERLEEKRELINENIKKSKHVHHVIDLAATEENGGVADNNDPETLTKDLRRWGEKDYVHPKVDKLAEIYNRELMEGTNKGV